MALTLRVHPHAKPHAVGHAQRKYVVLRVAGDSEEGEGEEEKGEEEGVGFLPVVTQSPTACQAVAISLP